MFYKKNNKINFISTIPGLKDLDKCLPKPAKQFIPEWFKNIPSNPSLSTVKVCPSFPDYFSQGYIVPMWSDIKLTYSRITDKFIWETTSNDLKWDTHGNEQFIAYTKPSFNGIEGQFVFKALCPWRVITPPGWSVLQLPLFYHFNQEWSILPGVIDTDIHAEINQQVLYHGDGKEIIIKRGDPFALYIPFKRSNKLKYEIRYQTPEDIKIFNKQDYNIVSKFRPSGVYRNLQRIRDKND